MTYFQERLLVIENNVFENLEGFTNSKPLVSCWVAYVRRFKEKENFYLVGSVVQHFK